MLCVYVMAPNTAFWYCLNKMYAALLLLPQIKRHLLGTFQN